MDITSKSIDVFRADFKKAVADLETKYDVKIELGGTSYSKAEMHFKTTIKNNTVDGVDFAEAEFSKLAFMYGFEPKDYNKVVKLGKEEFNLVGFNRKARKNTCMIKRVSDGADYVCSHNAIN